MARHKLHSAQREAKAAAQEANMARVQLEQKTALEKQKAETDKLKAQRLLMRSIRAGAGGIFESDQGSTLGGSGVIG